LALSLPLDGAVYLMANTNGSASAESACLSRVPAAIESSKAQRCHRPSAHLIIVLVLVHHSVLAYVDFGQFNRLPYLFVIWLQYALVNAHLSAIARII